jgi:hypothetical protein
MQNTIDIPFGPVDKEFLVDNFSYLDVQRNHCVADISKNICKLLVGKANEERVKYLAVCMTLYNEEFPEMYKTLLTLLENFEYLIREVKYW